jgi:hypothetical protein
MVCFRQAVLTSISELGGNHMLRVSVMRKPRRHVLPNGIVYGTITEVTRRPRWFWMWMAGQSSKPPRLVSHMYEFPVGPIRILVSWGKPTLPRP